MLLPGAGLQLAFPGISSRHAKSAAVQVLERVVPLVDNTVIQTTIKPCLNDLAEDSDVDVQFYARQALYACDNVQMQ